MRAILASLAAFLAACVKPRTPLAKAIVIALAIKFVVIVTMKVALFPGSAQPVVDAAAMVRLIGASMPVPQ